MDENDVSYSDSSSTYAPQRPVARGSGFARALIKWGMARDEQQANMVLLGVVVVAILVGAGAWVVL